MGIRQRKAGYRVSFFLLVLFFATALEAKTLLPEGVVVKETYKPGIGAPVGRVLLVQGDAVIIHAGKKEGFRAKKGHSIFKKDTIVTLEKGRIRFELNDGSILTLASETKMEINDSVFAPPPEEPIFIFKYGLGKSPLLGEKGCRSKTIRIQSEKPDSGCRCPGIRFCDQGYTAADPGHCL